MRHLPLLALVFFSCGPSVDEQDVPIAQLRSGLAMSSAGGCSTDIASGLSAQLIEELNCVTPNLMVNFRGPHVTLYSSVIPWLAPDAARDLKDATVARNDTMTVSSAYRTLGQQYLLYKWWKAGQCGIQVAAVPGTSNHQSGRAIDTPYYSAWRTALSAQGWSWLGSSDVVHFDHLASPNIALKSVLAFQRLWNKNHSTGRIAEDGDWGPATEAAMAQSPTTGFAKHGCATTGRLSGTVTQAGSTTPLSGVTVTAAGQTATTGTSGAFSFDLPAGSVTISAAKSGFTTASVTRTVVVGGTVSAPLSLTPVSTTGTLAGTVVDATDSTTTLSGATVSVGGRMISTDAQGTFTAALPAGTASWSVTLAGYEVKSGSSTITAGATTRVTVALVRTSADQPPRIELINAPSTSDFARVALSGTVSDDAPLTQVQLSPSLSVPVVNGAFEAEVVLSPGVNSFVVTARDSAGQETSVTWTVTFRAGFSGTVHRFDDGALILAGAQLELFDPDTGDSLGTALADVDGRYELVSSGTGMKRLHVEQSGYTPRDLLVDVSADERTTVDIGLTPGDFASIRFIEPSTEGPFDVEELTVSGVVTGFEVNAVTVNGVQAQLVGNGFVAKVPLPEGVTEFEAIAESAEGQSVRATVKASRAMREVKGGCSSAPGVLVLALGVLLIRRRRRSRG
jgi:hypothetical protein